MWIDHLRDGSNKKRFQHCLDSDGFIHYMRAIQGHFGGNKFDPSLLENVEVPYMWSEFFYHAGSSLDLRSILQSCGRKGYERRKTSSVLHSREIL